MDYIDIKDVVILKRFSNTPPSSKKVTSRVRRIADRGEELKIVINKDNVLVDGYASYLAYWILGSPVVPFVRSGFDIEKFTSLKEQVFTGSDYTCYICNRKLPKDDLTLDHVVPKSKGGNSDLGNLKCCCSLCNNLKADFTLSDELVFVIRKELQERGIKLPSTT